MEDTRKTHKNEDLAMSPLLRADRLAVSCLVALLLYTANSAGAVMLGLTPSSQTAAVGQTVSIDLVVDGLGDFAPDSLGAFDIDVAYDPAALTFSGYALGGFLGDLGLFEAADFSFGDLRGGVINLAELSFLEADAGSCFVCLPPFLDDVQPVSFVLATLDFMVTDLAFGDSTEVAIGSVNALSDAFGDALEIAAIDGAVIRGVEPTAMPSPAPLLLMLSGLAALGAFGNRARRFDAQTGMPSAAKAATASYR